MSSPNPLATIEMTPVTVADHEFALSVLKFHTLVTGDSDLSRLNAVYQQAADEFLASSFAARQKSACVVADMSSADRALTKAELNAWFGRVKEDSIYTQQWLFGLFKRPVLQIGVIPDQAVIDHLNHLVKTLTPSADTIRYAASLADGIADGKQMLKVAHRL